MVVKVLVELSNKNIDKTFDYIVPKILENKIKIGIRVTVPFAHQILEGFVLEIVYATPNNFTNEILYKEPICMLREKTAHFPLIT